MTNLKKPGLRAIKTALSILISIIPFYILGGESPFYAALGALMSTQGSVYSSFKVGRFRIIGTCIGSVTGMLMANFLQLNILAIFLGVILTIYIVNLLKLQGGTTLAVIAFLYTMTHSIEPTEYYFVRVSQTIFGVIVGVSINYLICPPKLHVRVERSSRDLAKRLLESIYDYVINKKSFDIEDLHNRFDNYKTALKDYKVEIKSNKRDILNYEKITMLHDLFHRIIGHCIILNTLNENYLLNDENYNELKKYFKDIELSELKKTNDFDEYNYNIKFLVQGINELNKLITDEKYHYK